MLDWVWWFLLLCSSGQLCILYTGDQVCWIPWMSSVFPVLLEEGSGPLDCRWQSVDFWMCHPTSALAVDVLHQCIDVGR